MPLYNEKYAKKKARKNERNKAFQSQHRAPHINHFILHTTYSPYYWEDIRKEDFQGDPNDESAIK